VLLSIWLLLYTKIGICGAGIAEQTGITYKKINSLPGKKIHAFMVDPKLHPIVSMHASEISDYNNASVDTMAEHAKALIGINGGFFKASKDLQFIAPAGILKIRDKWHGIAYVPRAAIGWSNHVDSAATIDLLATSTAMHVKNSTHKINVFNPVTTFKKNALFSFNGLADLNADAGACNATINNGKIAAINTKVMSCKADEYIFSVQSDGTGGCWLHDADLGHDAKLMVDVIPKHKPYLKWEQLEYIVGGGPILVMNHAKNTNYQSEIKNKKFIFAPHARTAVGVTKTGHWVLVIVEENPYLDLVGVTIPELADIMLSLGCEAAINLDGGSSTSLYLAPELQHEFGIKEANFLNKAVSDAILVMPGAS
jgi:exopolysaccharide biosynthesis protein